MSQRPGDLSNYEVGLKNCSRCSRSLPLSSFGKRDNRYYRSYCNECRSNKRRCLSKSQKIEISMLPDRLNITDENSDWIDVLWGLLKEHGEITDQNPNDIDINKLLKRKRNIEEMIKQ